MKALQQFGLALAIVAVTYYAIVRVAEEKAGALAGGDTAPLADQTRAERDAFEALLTQLRIWDQAALALALSQLRDDGNLWVAPHLSGDRSAIFVSSLGLVSRVYVRREELVAPELPFPGAGIPEPARRTFATIRLAGTLYHELQHHEGLEDEGATYDREIGWYRGLGATTLEGLQGEEKRQFEWAIDSAVQSADAARVKAVGMADGAD